MVLEQLRKELQKKKPDATLADAERSYGAAYREMVTEVRETLANLGEHFPSYQGQGFEMAGFVWFQAWSDMVDPDYNPCYAEQPGPFHSRRATRLQDTQSSVRYRSDWASTARSGLATNDLNFRAPRLPSRTSGVHGQREAGGNGPFLGPRGPRGRQEGIAGTSRTNGTRSAPMPSLSTIWAAPRRSAALARPSAKAMIELT